MGSRLVCFAVVALLLIACRRSEPGIPLIAAFSAESRVGRLIATWSPHGPDRARYHVDVVNQLADPLYVRLAHVRLLRAGSTVGRALDTVACVIPAGATARPLAGIATLQGGEADGFEIERFALPLSERGRGFYREYLLQRRPGQEASIDAEIAAYAQAPPCPMP